MTHRLTLLLVLPFALSLTACGTSEETQCSDEMCAVGNVCIGGKCVPYCERHTDCPLGQNCKPSDREDGKGACVAVEGLPIGRGQFGTTCADVGNKGCDAESGFICVGGTGFVETSNNSPADDPDAYCSKVDCASDADCPGEYECVGVDFPATKTDPQPRVRKVCIKRDFCSPAPNGVMDCPESSDRVIREKDGSQYCGRTCDPEFPDSCGVGNICHISGQCRPLVGTCASTQTFCSRCKSRDDCPDGGLCLFFKLGNYRFCSAPCTVEGGSCPGSPKTPTSGELAICRNLAGKGYQPFLQCMPANYGSGEFAACW